MRDWNSQVGFETGRRGDTLGNFGYGKRNERDGD